MGDVDEASAARRGRWTVLHGRERTDSRPRRVGSGCSWLGVGRRGRHDPVGVVSARRPRGRAPRWAARTASSWVSARPRGRRSGPTSSLPASASPAPVEVASWVELSVLLPSCGWCWSPWRCGSSCPTGRAPGWPRIAGARGGVAGAERGGRGVLLVAGGRAGQGDPTVRRADRAADAGGVTGTERGRAVVVDLVALARHRARRRSRPGRERSPPTATAPSPEATCGWVSTVVVTSPFAMMCWSARCSTSCRGSRLVVRGPVQVRDDLVDLRSWWAPAPGPGPSGGRGPRGGSRPGGGRPGSSRARTRLGSETTAAVDAVAARTSSS